MRATQSSTTMKNKTSSPTRKKPRTGAGTNRELPEQFPTLPGEAFERKEAREMYFRNFSVKVIQGPHRERSFALDRIYQVLAVYFENTESNKTSVLLEDDNHSLQWVPSNEVKVTVE